MNDQARDSEPPDEPYLRSEANPLSPASPKPLQFPQPTNIPVLENMMDVGFNQTEAHMNDLRDTELRPGAWRDPDEQRQQSVGSADQPSPYSTGGEAIDTPKEFGSTNVEPSQVGGATTNSNQTLSNGHDPHSAQLSNGVSHEANVHSQAEVAADATTSPTDAPLPSSDPSVPAAEPAPAPIADSFPIQSNEVTLDQSQSMPATGAVDVQSLLDTLQTSVASAPEANAAPSAEGLTVTTTLSPSHSQAQPPVPGAEPSSSISASGLGAPPSGLPPRPPPQEQPLINSNYVHANLRDYHPHASHQAVQHARSSSSANGDSNAAAFAQNAQGTAPIQAPPEAGQSQGRKVAPQPSHTLASSSKSFPPSNTSVESRRDLKASTGETPTVDDQPWTQDIQRKYDQFLEEERKYVGEARWEQFPQGSRLFVGNLSSERVTKRDIFHVFHTYGELAQISIKQAYGFVQFLRTEDCMRALTAEQGRQIRDKRIHLEISKPQKGSNKNQQQNAPRRSRSPDFGGRGRPGSNVDRYAPSGRGTNGRGREGYRPSYRSPSPRDYRDSRDNRYEQRYRTRSRSPGYRGYRGASPRREPDDELPLPRRQPQDVPDVQIISMDQLDRDFLAWVEKAFTSRGVRVDVLMISPRLNEEAVVRRQIVEGVLAVSKLRRVNQDTGKISLTIFKRKAGTRDVQFEDYDNLDPNISVELVLREKQLQGGPGGAHGYGYQAQPQYGAYPPQQQYGYQSQPPPTGIVPPVGYPPGYQPAQTQPPAPYGQPQHRAPPPGAPPVMPPSMQDPNNLQNLLSTLNPTSPTTPQTAGSAPPYGYPPHTAYPPQQPPQQQYRQPQDPYAAYRNQQAPQTPQMGSPPGQQPPNMQDILARLGSYRQ